MLGFVNNWFAPKANPIGVDFGSDSLRLAQVQMVGNDYQLVAAASCDVPSHVRNEQSARLQFFVEATRDLLTQGGFQGRNAVLSLPASSMFIQHLRLAKMDDQETKKALMWEARGKLPIDPSQALLRHLIAGEVYHDQEPRNEVIVMASSREFVDQYLAAAAKTKLSIVGMNVEPKALVDCFSQVYRRKTDLDVTNFFVDIGSVGTRAVIARGRQILFARSIPIGGDHLARAVAQALAVGFEQAKLLRMQMASGSPAPDPQPEKVVSDTPAVDSAAADSGFALISAGMQQSAAKQRPSIAPEPIDQQRRRIDEACNELLSRLIEELDMCRRYYESAFPSKPVDRLIFVGGEARQRSLCQRIARELGLAAQVGDPLVRMGRTTEIGVESGIDRREPQPAWAVAIGLSMGPEVSAGKPVAAKG